MNHSEQGGEDEANGRNSRETSLCGRVTFESAVSACVPV